MDPTAGVTVSLGTLGVSCAGGLSGTLYALVKSEPAAVMGFAAGVNSGIAGLTFFALREYAISPALLLSVDNPHYARRRAQLGIALPQFNSSQPTPNDEIHAIRRERLLDSGLAGSITGAGLNFWKNGPRAMIPGAVTAGLACALLQMGANELAVQRIRYVAGTPVTAMIPAHSGNEPLPATSTSTPSTVPIASPAVAVVHQSAEAAEPPKSTMQKIVETLTYVIPLTRIDDKDYLEKLERKRTVLDDKIDKLHTELKNSPSPPS